MTTNELANWPRYQYLRASDGAFHNPFDHGCKNNCMETMYPATVPPAPVILPADTMEGGARFKSEDNCRMCHAV